jgi:hypothetical protein
MVYPALLPLMRTPRLPVADWTDTPADLNWLVRFAERRNLVSASVPSHFKRSLPQMCCVACLRLLTMAKLSRHVLFAVPIILREPEVSFNALLFLLNKYVTVGITARSYKVRPNTQIYRQPYGMFRKPNFIQWSFASTKFTGYVKYTSWKCRWYRM